MNTSLKNRFAAKAFRQGLLWGLIGAVLTGFTVVSTVTSTNIGPTGGNGIRLVRETFSDDPDVVVLYKRISVGTAQVAKVGDSAPGLEATSAIPQINNDLDYTKYQYEFEVKEAAANSWQSGENFKVAVWRIKDGSNNHVADLYFKQVTVDDASIEGVHVVASTGDSIVLGNIFSIIITRQ